MSIAFLQATVKATISANMIEIREIKETAMNIVSTIDFIFDVHLRLRTNIQKGFQSYAQNDGVRRAYRSSVALEKSKTASQILVRGVVSNTSGFLRNTN